MLTIKRKIIGLFIAVLLATLAVTGVWALTVEPWHGAGVISNVSSSGDVQADVSIATEQDEVAVVWAGGVNAPGIYLAHFTKWGWSRSAITLTGNKANRFPAVVFSGSEPWVAWSQSEDPIPYNSKAQNLLQQDGINPAQKIVGPVYGRITPDMDKSPTGLHLVFPASTLQSFWSKNDLYYTHRYMTETTWSPPTMVLTHAQVVPAADLGKIWYPKLGVTPDGQTLHVVWQQNEVNTGQETSKIWTLSGSWHHDGVVWGTPTQISPAGQDHVVRPNIAVSESGIVHITWTELVVGSGGRSNPDSQQINYRQLANPTITKVNIDPIKVNSNSPTWASSALALNGQDICIAWHGFYEDLAETLEEITMRCSRNEGKTWLSLVNVSDSPFTLSDFPVMALDSMGNAHIAWEERELVGSSYEPLDIFYRGGIAHRPTTFLPSVMRQG